MLFIGRNGFQQTACMQSQASYGHTLTLSCPSASPSINIRGSPRVAGTEALTSRGRGTGDCGLWRGRAVGGMSSITLSCAPPNLYLHLGGFSLPLFYFFTSRCLTRDLPTFHVREAHKNPGGFSVKGGPRPGPRQQGKDRR